MEGIIGYGAYIPRNRIKVEEIAKVWGADAPSYKRGLMLEEKSVPSPDQDTITMSVEASKSALKRAGIAPSEIGAVYIGSESHPYAVKPSGTVLAEAIGATPEVHTADFEFACNDPQDAKEAILGCIQATGDCNHVIAPMNTKISTIASALLALADDEIQLCYAQAALYNYENYSIPGDTCYILDFQELLSN